MEPCETESASYQLAKYFSELTISKTSLGKYQGSFEAHPQLFGTIIGQKGSVIKSIQSSTKTKVIIPKEGSHVVINGSSECSVTKAYEEIASIIRSLHTHFLSIPIEDESLLNKFELFKEKVLQKCTIKSRITEQAFRTPNKLNLRFSYLNLSGENAIKNCVEKIDKFRKENANLFKPLKINFKGVDYLGDDLETAIYLYAKPVESNDLKSLLSLAFKLQKFLMEENILPENYEHQPNFELLLMHKSFCDPKIKSFDITEFFDEVKDWDFWSFDVGELHLSEKRTGDHVNYYTNCGTWYFDKDDITK